MIVRRSEATGCCRAIRLKAVSSISWSRRLIASSPEITSCAAVRSLSSRAVVARAMACLASLVISTRRSPRLSRSSWYVSRMSPIFAVPI